MNRWWKSYSHFSSIESKGIIALVSLIAILLVIFISMPYWLPERDFNADPELVAAFEKYKQEHLLPEDRNEYTEEAATERTLFGQYRFYAPWSPIEDSTHAAQLAQERQEILQEGRPETPIYLEGGRVQPSGTLYLHRFYATRSVPCF